MVVSDEFAKERSQPIVSGDPLTEIPTDLRWVADRLGLGIEPTDFSRSAVNENLEAAIVDSGYFSFGDPSDPKTRHSETEEDICNTFVHERFTSELDIIRHEMSWPDHERMTIEVHPDYYVLAWTTSLPVSTIGNLFEEDLQLLAGSEAEAALSDTVDAYVVPPANLSAALRHHSEEVNWFRVNLANESMTWFLPASTSEFGYGTFALTSATFDVRLITALLTKTATALVRGSTRRILHLTSDVYRSPTISIRRPSMLHRFIEQTQPAAR